MQQEFFKPAEVAVWLGVSPRRVYQLIRAGEIPATMIGGAIRISRLAWKRWARKKAETADAKPRLRGAP